MGEEFICPIAWKWNEIYLILVEARQKKLREVLMRREKLDIPTPPIPLILAAWDAPDSDKRERWQKTIQWAEMYNFADLIPKFTKEESYCA